MGRSGPGSKWITDSKNKYGRSLEEKVRAELIQELDPTETVQTVSRAMYVDPGAPDQMIDAYVLVTSNRTIVQLLDTRRPWALGGNRFEFLNDKMSALLFSPGGGWCRLTVRDYLPLLVPDPENPLNEVDAGFFLGDWESDLIETLAHLIKGSGGEVTVA